MIYITADNLTVGTLVRVSQVIQSPYLTEDIAILTKACAEDDKPDGISLQQAQSCQQVQMVSFYERPG